MNAGARKQIVQVCAPLISRSQGVCDDLWEVHTYVQRTGVCAMATVELRWMEERVDNLIALLDERPCLYNMKYIDYINRDKKKKALDEIAAVLALQVSYTFFIAR